MLILILAYTHNAEHVQKGKLPGEQQDGNLLLHSQEGYLVRPRERLQVSRGSLCSKRRLHKMVQRGENTTQTKRPVPFTIQETSL